MTGRGWALDSARSSLLPQPHLPRPHLPRPLAFSPAARNAPVRVSATAARRAASCAPRPRAPRRAGSYEERVVSVTAAMRTQYDPARDSPRRNELKRKDVAFEEVGAQLHQHLSNPPHHHPDHRDYPPFCLPFRASPTPPPRGPAGGTAARLGFFGAPRAPPAPPPPPRRVDTAARPLALRAANFGSQQRPPRRFRNGCLMVPALGEGGAGFSGVVLRFRAGPRGAPATARRVSRRVTARRVSARRVARSRPPGELQRAGRY